MSIAYPSLRTQACTSIHTRSRRDCSRGFNAPQRSEEVMAHADKLKRHASWIRRAMPALQVRQSKNESATKNAKKKLSGTSSPSRTRRRHAWHHGRHEKKVRRGCEGLSPIIDVLLCTATTSTHRHTQRDVPWVAHARHAPYILCVAFLDHATKHYVHPQ